MKAKSSVKGQNSKSLTKWGIFAILVFVVLLCSMLAMPFGEGEANAAQNAEASSLAATPRATVTDTTIKFDPKNYGYEWGKIRYKRTLETNLGDSPDTLAPFYVNDGSAVYLADTDKIDLAKGGSTQYYDCLVKKGLPSYNNEARDSTFLLLLENGKFTNYYYGYKNVSAIGVSPIALEASMILQKGRKYAMVSLNQTSSNAAKIVVQSDGVARINYAFQFDGKWSTTTRYLTATGFQDNATNAVVATNFATVPEAKSFTYDGTAKVPYSSGTNYTVAGITSGTNADSYSTTFTLKAGNHWTDGTNAAKTVNWKIEPKTVTLSELKIGGVVASSYNSFKDITPSTAVEATITGLLGTDTLDINAVWEAEPSASGKRNIVLSSSNSNYVIANSEIPIDYYADYYYVGDSKTEVNCRVLTNENLAGLMDDDMITIVGNPKVTDGMAIDKAVTICGENVNSGFDVSSANIKIGALGTLDSTFRLFNVPSGGGITLSNGGKLDITRYNGDILNVKADSSVPLGSALVTGDKTKINLAADETDGEIRFGYEKEPGELLLGGLKITGTSVSADGKMTISGSIVGDNTKLNVVISDFDGNNEKDVTRSAIFNADGSFDVNSNEVFTSGKKIVTLTYTVGGYTLSSSTLVTIPLRDEGCLNGEIDFGDLGEDSISYKDKDGVAHDLPVSEGKVTLTDDMVVDPNGNVIITIKDKNTGKETDVIINVGGGRTEITNDFDKSNIVVRDTTLTVKTEAGFEYCVEDKDGKIIEGCGWTSGTNNELVFNVLENTEYVVKARAKGSENQQPGVSVVVDVKTKSTVVQTAQDDAKVALDTAAQTVKDKIDALTGLTQQEKDVLKVAIDTSVTAGKKEIELKDTVDFINAAKEATQAEFDTIVEEATILSVAKDTAKSALDELAEAEKAEIDKLTGLTEKDKTDAKTAIDNALSAGKTAIEGKNGVDDITEAKNLAEIEIKKVTTDSANLSVAKTEAKNDLDTLATAEKAKIDALGNLSVEEKQIAKNAIDATLTAEKEKIDKLPTVTGVETQKAMAITSIKKITTDVAKNVVRDYAEEVKAEIDNSSLTSAEKQSAKDEINELISIATTGIDNATDSASLSQVVTDGMDNTLGVYQNVVEKEFAEFFKEYTAGGKYADDYDDVGKTAISTAKQSGEVLIGNATSISGLHEGLKSAKDGVINVKPKAPTATVDCVNEQLNGLKPNGVYTVSDGTSHYILTADSDGNIALCGKDSSGNGYDFGGKTLAITKNGITDIQVASNPQTVEVPERAVTPDPEIDYIDKIINFGKPDADFTVTVDGEKIIVRTDSNGEIDLKDEWIGKTVSFAENSNSESALGSLSKEITIKKYWTLTFQYNDGGTTTDKRYAVNDGQTAPIQSTDPTRSGYLFLGWFQDSACTAEWSFKYSTVNGNTVIYAGWQAEHSGVNTVTVTFVAEGQLNETKSIDKNTTVTSQNVAAPNGKTFAGWYTDSDFKYKYDFKNKVTENITLYAKFVTSKIVVTMPDGTVTELNYGDKLDRPIDPTNAGYKFAGWYTDSGCNDALLFAGGNTKDGITQNITLYPKWVQETHTVTGTIIDEDGNPVANTDITIEIQPGGKKMTTDAYGRFTITDVPDGNYRIVVKYEKGENITVVTEAILVNGADITLPNIHIMGENLNSKVEIGENAPDVVVSGLNDLFGSDKYVSDAEKQKAKLLGNKAELKFVVTDSGQNKLLNDYAAENKKQIGSYLDFTLFKIMTINGIESTSYLSNLDSILKVIIPLSADMQGKTNYIIYRIHNGEMQEIKLGLENANVDGEYIELSNDGKYLSVYTKNFSSYAIAFDEQAPVGEQVPVVENSCFIHWIVLALILAFLILIALFTILFAKKCLANIITWVAYVIGLFVLAFFVWSCVADITLWILGVVLAILSALIYLFVDKKKKKGQGKKEEIPETKVIG